MNAAKPPTSKAPPLLTAIHDALWTASSFIGTVLFVFALGVVILSFPGKYSNAVLVPALIPVFSVPFGIVFVVTQYALVAFMKSYKGLALVTAFFLIGMALAYVRKFVWGAVDAAAAFSRTGSGQITLARHVVVSGACVSALVLGVALWKDYLYTPRRPRS